MASYEIKLEVIHVLVKGKKIKAFFYIFKNLIFCKKNLYVLSKQKNIVK